MFPTIRPLSIELTSLAKLFVQQKILHPSESVPLETSRTTLGPGRHIFAFDLNFPDTSSRPQSDIESCTRCRSSLPQCFAFRSDVLTVSVSYRLRAVIERPGLLKSNITTIQNVEYYPLLSSVRTPTDELGPSEITTRASAVALGIKEHGSNHATITLPPYSPSVMVQIASAASRTIRPGDFLHLEIALSVPAEPQQILGLVWLCNLTIRLKATTMAAVGPYRQRDVTSINVCNVSGLLPLEMSSEATQINLPSVLWQDYIYPSVIPSFQLCGVGRSYQLEVVVGFACHYTTNIFVRCSQQST